MTEVSRIALRVVGVAAPALLLLGVSELQGGAPSGDFGTYLEVLWVTALVSGAWAARDGRGSDSARTGLRWVVVAVVVGGAAGMVTALLSPGSAPGEWLGQAAWLALFHGAWPLVGAAVGLVAATAGSRKVSGSRPAPPRGRG